MYQDLVSYCSDIEALRAELIAKGYVEEDTGEPSFPLINRTPTQKANQPQTVTLIRCVSELDIELLASFESIEILGTKEEVDADPDKTAKYELAYSRDSYTMTDPETGEVITKTPPYWHGTFA